MYACNPYVYRVHSAATTPAPCTLPAPKSKPSQDKAGRQSWARQDKGKARKERGRKSPFPSKSPPSDSPFDHPRGKTSRRQLNRAGLSIDRRPSIRSGIDNNTVTAHTAATVPSPAHIAAIDKQCVFLACTYCSVAHTHCPERPFPRRPVSSRLNTPNPRPSKRPLLTSDSEQETREKAKP